VSVSLKGMTWSHPRGYDPIVGCSALWKEKTAVEIGWDKRSLQDFESFPVEELACAYDLIVIDHPHIGQITAERCLAPLDVPGREIERNAIAAGSIGLSYPSYTWEGRQWAFPIDAATQVQAYRPDALDAPLARWGDVLALARQGKVLLPLRPPHSLMSFYTLTGNLGHPCSVERDGDLIARDKGAGAFELLRELVGLVDPACFGMDPIGVFEKMVEPGSRVVSAPLIYGYVNYAIKGFSPNRLAFADIAVAGSSGPVGSALGGTGIAVSAFSSNPEAAIDFAYWIAGGEMQSTLYSRSGGQPGHAQAWGDKAVNAATGGFYRNTRATLEGAWVRPRHDGCMAFQQAASDRLNEGLLAQHDPGRVIDDLNRLFRDSFAHASVAAGS
jgi:multiple sugar transport system substrate-binding protein